MTEAAVGHHIRQRISEAKALTARLEDVLTLSPELTPVDPTTSNDVDRVVHYLERINEMTRRRAGR